MKVDCSYHTNKTNNHKNGFSLGFVWKVRPFRTQNGLSSVGVRHFEVGRPDFKSSSLKSCSLFLQTSRTQILKAIPKDHWHPFDYLVQVAWNNSLSTHPPYPPRKLLTTWNRLANKEIGKPHQENNSFRWGCPTGSHKVHCLCSDNGFKAVFLIASDRLR